MHATAVEPLGPYPARLTDCLMHWAGAAPERVFLAGRDSSGQWRHVTYAQALSIARRIGQALLDRRLSAERPVAILSENDLDHALLALGCMVVGVPWAPVSPAYSLVAQDFERLKYVLDLLSPGLVFASPGEAYLKAVQAVVPHDVELVVPERFPSDRPLTLFATLAGTEVTSQVDTAHDAVGPDSIAKFLFTSGSTKTPKAVINTHRMLCASMQMLRQCWPFLAEEPPVVVDWLPWHHTFGGNQNVGLVLYNGGSLYIDEGKPTPKLMGKTLANLREISPTIHFNVPKGWNELARALEADTELRASYYRRLRLQFYAGASLSQSVWDKLDRIAEAEIGERVVMTTGFGMTETSPCALWVLHDCARAGELGVPSPGLEIKLVPSGDKLEIRYRGPNVTPGYWRSAEATREAFDRDGFLCSGDAVRWRDPANPDAGFLFDGRLAEDFKLDTGTWVHVGLLRSRAVEVGAPYVQDVVVTGHDRQEVGMLVVPNIQECCALAKQASDAPLARVCDEAAVRGFFQQLVNTLHAEGTGCANRVGRALIMHEPLSLSRGEVTDKGTVNQRAVLEHRAALVDLLYSDGPPSGVILPSDGSLPNGA